MKIRLMAFGFGAALALCAAPPAPAPSLPSSLHKAMVGSVRQGDGTGVFLPAMFHADRQALLWDVDGRELSLDLVGSQRNLRLSWLLDGRPVNLGAPFALFTLRYSLRGPGLDLLSHMTDRHRALLALLVSRIEATSEDRSLSRDLFLSIRGNLQPAPASFAAEGNPLDDYLRCIEWCLSKFPDDRREERLVCMQGCAKVVPNDPRVD